MSILYFSRYALLEMLLTQQLQSRNIPLQSITLSNISLNNLLIRDLSLGARKELQIEQIDISWNLNGLIKGELETVSINGVAILLDLSGNQPVLGSLHPLIASSNDNKGDHSALLLPAISRLQTDIAFRSEQGDLRINLSGKINPREALDQEVLIDFRIAGFSLDTNGQFNATIDAMQMILGRVMITDGSISRPELEIAQFNGEATFKVAAMKPQALEAKLDLNQISLPLEGTSSKQAYQQASLHLQLNENSAELAGKLWVDDHTQVMNLQANAVRLSATPDYNLSVNVNAQASYLPWNLLSVASPTSGSISFDMQMQGLNTSIQWFKENPIHVLSELLLDGKAHLDVQALNYEQKISNLAMKLDTSFSLEKGMGFVNLTNDNFLKIATINQAWLKQLGLPEVVIQDIAKGAEIQLFQPNNHQIIQIDSQSQPNQLSMATHFSTVLRSAQSKANLESRGQVALSVPNTQKGSVPFNVKELSLSVSDTRTPFAKIEQLTITANAKGTTDAWTGGVTFSTKRMRLKTDSMIAEKIQARIPLIISANQSIWSIHLPERERVQFNLIDATKQFTIHQPLNLNIQRFDLQIQPETPDLLLNHHVRVALSPFSVEIPQQNNTLNMTIHPGHWTLEGKIDPKGFYQNYGKWRDASLNLPQSMLELNQIGANFQFKHTPGDQKIADFSIGKIQHRADHPFFALHRLSGNIYRYQHKNQTSFTLNLTGGLPNKQYLTFYAEHNLNTGKGKLNFDLIPLQFSPASLQISDLLPGLSEITDAEGAVSAMARLNWTRSGIQDSKGQIDVKQLSFAHPTAKINKMDTSVHFNSLIPLATPPQQSIDIQQVGAAVPIENLAIRFQIESDSQKKPRIQLERTFFSLFAGNITTEPTLIDPFAKSTRLTINLNEINLGQFFKAIQIEGLDGEGLLYGRVPIILDGKKVTIDHSHLTAKSPGVLRFHSDKASQMLAHSGEEMNLVLQALEDFHYSELALSMDKSPEHDLTATLSLLGKNPAVKSGQLIRLNINLTSNLEKILEAIIQAYSLSNEILSDLFR